MNSKIFDLLEKLEIEVVNLNSVEEQIQAVNFIREAISKISPFEKEPIDCVKWIPADELENNFNDISPEKESELDLLHECIKSNGYTNPILVYKIGNQKYEIADGLSASIVGKKYKDINERLHGYLPVVIINEF